MLPRPRRVSPRLTMPLPYTFRERWRFRNDRPTNHPRTSFQTRVWGTRSQRWFYVDGILASVVDVAPGPFLAVYAIALGATDAQVGMLAIATGLAGFLALVPGAKVAEVTGSRRWVVLIGGSGIARVALLAMALAPLFFPGLGHAVWALIGLSFVRSFAINMSHASWVSLLADIIPIDLRRFYVAQRMLAITVAGALAAPLIGFAIRAIGGVSGFQVMFGVAFLVSIAAWYCYYRVEEPRRPARAQRPSGSTREMLEDRRFVRFMLALFMLQLTSMLVGPFIMAYFVREIGAGPSTVGLYATLEQATAVGGQFVLGLFVSRIPPERLVKAVLFLPALIPALWLSVDSVLLAALPFAVGGLAWAVYNVAVFNLLMEYAPSQNIPRYAALQQTFILFAQFAGPILGTLVVANWGIGAALVLSLGGRLGSALVMLVPLRFIPALRPRARPPAAVEACAPAGVER